MVFCIYIPATLFSTNRSPLCGFMFSICFFSWLCKKIFPKIKRGRNPLKKICFAFKRMGFLYLYTCHVIGTKNLLFWQEVKLLNIEYYTGEASSASSMLNSSPGWTMISSDCFVSNVSWDALMMHFPV
jgi:hypothetical protein